MKITRFLKDRLIYNEKGAALLAVFVVIMVLLTLGMGLIALTFGNIQQANITDTYEKAYYVADGGAQQGIDFVKNSVKDVYRILKAEVATAGIVDTTNNNSTKFFELLTTELGTFTSGALDTSSQAGITGLGVSIADITNAGDTRTYLVTSSAKKGTDTIRVVQAYVKVNFVKVDLKSVTFRDETVITLGTFTQKPGANGMTINGDTIANKYDIVYYNSVPQVNFKGAQKKLSDFPEANSDALNWQLNYAKRLAASNVIKSISSKKTTGFALTVVPDQVSSEPNSFSWNVFKGNKPTTFPFRITDANSASPKSMEVKIWNDVLESLAGQTQIDTAKDLTIGAPISGTASNRVQIYCGGDLTIDSTLQYADVYVAGKCTVSKKVTNVTINCVGDFILDNGEGISGTTVFSGGNMTITKKLENTQLNCKGDISLTGSGLFGTNKIYSGGSISMNASTTGTLVMYAEKTFTAFGGMSFDAKGIIYTNGSIAFDHVSVQFEGQIVAKNSISFDGGGGNNIKKNIELVNSLEADPFVTLGTVKTVIVPSIAAVIPAADITVSEK